MMEGVVQRGTATVVKQVGKPIAGKTGTTNDERDVWFVGFSPDLAVGVYLGYDKPRQIGNRATGGGLAAPIVTSLFKEALKDKPAVPFRVPAGIKLIRIDAKSGMRVAGGAEGGRVILEGFKPGTAPPDSYSVIGYSESSQHQDGGGQPAGQGGGFFGQGGLFGGGQQQPGYVPPQRQIRSGTGGLY
jgi:penicillin-binding protein 1A